MATNSDSELQLSAPAPRLAVVIDARERALVEALQARSLPEGVILRTAGLQVGDVQFVQESDCASDASEEPELLLALERKTMPDLLSSVRDGRYIEQKARALACVGRARYAYVLEGAGPGFWTGGSDARFGGGPELRSLQTCVLTCMLRDGLHVLHSDGVDDTAALVVAMAERAAGFDPPSAYFGGRAAHDSGSEQAAPSAAYKSTLQVRRRDNASDPRTVAELQVAQVPGVSVANAAALLDAFGARTLVGFGAALGALPGRKARIKALVGVPKIGKKKAEALLDLLFPDLLA